MLYHISEEANIDVFHPRKSETRPDLPPMVWALNGKRLVNYLFPRECPRIIYRKSSEVSEEDLRLFFAYTAADTIVTVESAWYERMRTAALFKYSFEPTDFELLDETAGYYIAHRTIKPVNVERMEDLVERLLSHEVELKITPDLHPLRDALLQSTVTDFSIIRFRNAGKGRE